MDAMLTSAIGLRPHLDEHSSSLPDGGDGHWPSAARGGIPAPDFRASGGKRWTGKMVGDQAALALGHHGDSSDYRLEWPSDSPSDCPRKRTQRKKSD